MTLEISHSLPPEIIREILLKLPVESLLRCKSVCKEWYSLISDRNFIKTHYTLSSTNNINYKHHRLIYSTNQQEGNLNSCPLYDVLFHKSVSNSLLLENQFQSAAINIVGSCNGLVCLCVGDCGALWGLFIYNPSTRIWNELLFFNRYSRPESYSFGYDESTDDYKIVEMSTTSEVHIYSLKTGMWKNLGDFSYECPWDARGIFFNGALQWVAYGFSPRTQRIVSLDLAKEAYVEVLLFEYDECANNLITLGVLGECLCGLSYYYKTHVDLWVMKVYGVKDSWTKMASFPYLTNHWIDDNPVPLFISNDGKVLLYSYLNLMIYNLKDSSSPNEIADAHKFREGCIVVESLVSPLGSRKGNSASMASSTRGKPTSTVSLTSLNSKEFNNMTSGSYWLSRIRESEEAAMHHISLEFFKLALKARCQNIKQLRDELESYDCRHNLLGLGKSAKQVFHSYHIYILKQQEDAPTEYLIQPIANPEDEEDASDFEPEENGDGAEEDAESEEEDDDDDVDAGNAHTC